MDELDGMDWPTDAQSKRNHKVLKTVEEFKGVRPTVNALDENAPNKVCVKNIGALKIVSPIKNRMIAQTEDTKETWEYSQSRNLWMSVKAENIWIDTVHK